MTEKDLATTKDLLCTQLGYYITGGLPGSRTCRCAYILGVLVQAEGDKLLEELGVISLQLRRVALGDEEEHSHGMEVCVRGFPMCQLNRCDAQ